MKKAEREILKYNKKKEDKQELNLDSDIDFDPSKSVPYMGEGLKRKGVKKVKFVDSIKSKQVKEDFKKGSTKEQEKNLVKLLLAFKNKK
jgi:hypothetical protein